MEVFDEDKAVEFILNRIDTKDKYNCDDILEVIDIIWDYYEDNGMLDINMDVDDSDDDIERDKIVEYVIRMVKKDRGTRLAVEDVPAIVDAELGYEALCDDF